MLFQAQVDFENTISKLKDDHKALVVEFTSQIEANSKRHKEELSRYDASHQEELAAAHSTHQEVLQVKIAGVMQSYQLEMDKLKQTQEVGSIYICILDKYMTLFKTSLAKLMYVVTLRALEGRQTP